MAERTFRQTIQLRGPAPAEGRRRAEIDATLTCTLLERRDQRECRVELRAPDAVVRGSGPDFFEAFCGVREQLEPRGLVPVCYGASRNVFPSRMSRERSVGLQAYRLELGRAGRKEDLVSIFATGEGVEPVSVADQRHFFDQWLNTLGSAPRRSDS